MSDDFAQVLRHRLAKLDADYVKHRAALLTALACETGKEPDALLNVEIPPRPITMLPADTRNQLEIVKAAIDAIVNGGGAASFTKESVRDMVRSLKPDISENVLKNMSSFLWHLHKHDGYITVVQKGQGHRQSVYMKTKQ